MCILPKSAQGQEASYILQHADLVFYGKSLSISEHTKTGTEDCIRQNIVFDVSEGIKGVSKGLLKLQSQECKINKLRLTQEGLFIFSSSKLGYIYQPCLVSYYRFVGNASFREQLEGLNANK